MKRYLLLSFLLAGFLWSGAAFATITISDSQSLLTQVHQLHGPLDFNKLFPLNSTASLTRYVESCEIGCSDSTPDSFGGCSIVCKEIPQIITRSVISVETNKATVYGAEDGYYEEFTPETIRTCGETLVEKFLSNLDVTLNMQGHLELNKLSNFQLPVSEGTPRSRKVTAYSLWGEFTPEGMHTSFPVKVSFIPDAPGTAQIALFSAINQVYFKVKDY